MNYTHFDFDKLQHEYQLVPTLIEPKLFRDNRGYFYESFNLKDFRNNINPFNKTHPNILLPQDIYQFYSFVQDNESVSSKGTLRGLHYQTGSYEQAKLVRVIKGSVYDVAVDIRPNSKTFGKWVGVHLSGENHQQFFIPRGFAHGFIALEDNTIFQYKCDNYYNTESEGALNWDSVNIPWTNFIEKENILLSEKDNNCKTTLKDILKYK